MKIQISFLMSLALFSSLTFADWTASKKQILVSLGDLKENQGYLWKKKTCDQIHSIANQIVSGGVDVVCRNFDTDSFADTGVQNASSKYDYQLRILRNKKDELHADVTKYKRMHEADFKTIGWTFTDGVQSKITKEAAMAKAIGNFFFYAQNETAFKAGLLVNGASESNEYRYDQKKGVFIDKITETPMSTNAAFSRFEHESERKKNYLRTGIEIGSTLSAGLAVYYAELDSNRVDFDYTLKSGLKSKLTGSAVKFDDNSKQANYGHEFAGVLYTQAARANGFNNLESFLIGYASSTAWEFIEYHEVLSINDEILTPIGGYVIGEASYQLACALLQKNNVVAKALAYTVNPMLGINHGIDKLKSKNKYASQPDCKEQRWSDISVYLGLDAGQKPYDPKMHASYIAGLNATVMNIDKYGEVGNERKLIYDTAMTKTNLELNGNDGAIDLRLVAQVVHAAYYQKNITEDQNGQMRGYEFQIGLGSSSTWNDRGTTKKQKATEDFYGTVGILGATAHADLYYKGYKISADLAFYGDFTMVKSYSLSKYASENPNGTQGMSSVIQKHGYYWGAGTSTIAAIAIQKGRFEIGYNGQFSQSNSINSRLRKQNEITNNAEFEDTMFSNRVYVSFQITKNLKIKLAEEIIVRTGSIDEETKTSGTEYRTMGMIVYQF